MIALGPNVLLMVQNTPDESHISVGMGLKMSTSDLGWAGVTQFNPGQPQLHPAYQEDLLAEPPPQHHTSRPFIYPLTRTTQGQVSTWRNEAELWAFAKSCGALQTW